MDASKIADPVLRASLEHIGDMLKEQAEEAAVTTLREPPANDNQPDFFVPGLYDVAVKDAFSVMDVAVFRLSKSQTRKGETIRHVRDDHVLEIASDAGGMATIYDYDIVLFMISHLADQTRLWRARPPA